MGKIIIKQGDITQEQCDCIVNAANTSLRGGGGVDGAIHRAAGPTVLEECKTIGGCKTSDAVITGAGNLKVKRIVHTVGPVWSGGKRKEADLLRKAYRNSFEIAAKNGLKSIAFPAISTGAYGYPIEEATYIALKEGIDFQDQFDEILFVCFSQNDLKIYERCFADLSSRKGS